MQSSPQEINPILGTAMAGGFYAGRINIDGQAYALIVAPKAEGEHADTIWHSKAIDGALSYCDGLANTQTLAEAGSKLAQWARDLRTGGFDDWYLPSQDELEICYRNLKPTTEANYCWARSGINLSALDPTRPYTPDFPVQTSADPFRESGAEAFDPVWYWSSTRHASAAESAWGQYFSHGSQNYDHRYDELRARAVRRLPI
ncbi:MAG: hypothetical protein H6R10_729 [Rhodocyclaceae bacterium]|nr:hypothetical protein [Rhodocyclaceae bacterium]